MDNSAEMERLEQEADRRKRAAAHARILACVDSLIGLAAATAPVTPIDQVIALVRRFSAVQRSLRVRRLPKKPLVLADEYDVQYLLGALLAATFDDVRVEEWTPSRAGAASRMDFLLKAERIVIEAKFVRSGHADREIGAELIVDRKRYAAHSDCRALVCFVYDPEQLLRHPVALERDLAEDGPMPVRIIVHSK